MVWQISVTPLREPFRGPRIAEYAAQRILRGVMVRGRDVHRHRVAANLSVAGDLH